MRPGHALVLALAAALSSCRGYERHWFSGPKAEVRAPAPPPVLPEEAFRLDWLEVALPAQLAPGQAVDVRVRLRNASTVTWPAGERSDPRGRVRLTWRWWSPEGVPGVYAERVEFPDALGPGQALALVAHVTAPAVPGQYRVQFDLVAEHVTWFEPHGVEPSYTAVAVR